MGGWNISNRLVHLDVEVCSEELLRQQSYAIKNQLGHPKLAKQFLRTVLDIEVVQSVSYVPPSHPKVCHFAMKS